MGETASNEKAPKTDFIKGLKAEFNKIIWPDKDTLTKETVVVVVSTVILGIVIAALTDHQIWSQYCTWLRMR